VNEEALAHWGLLGQTKKKKKKREREKERKRGARSNHGGVEKCYAKFINSFL